MNTIARVMTIVSVLLLSLCVSALDIPAGSLSAGRVTMLQQLTEKAWKSFGKEAPLSSVISQITSEALKKDPQLAANGKALLLEHDSERTGIEKMEARIAREYPRYAIREMDAKAAELYPKYKVGDRITVLYKTNPKTVKSITGVFMGTLPNGMIKVGSQWRVRLQDMNGIESNEGEHGEISKLDPKYNAELREKWKSSYHLKITIGGKKFAAENKQKFIDAQMREDFLANERNGYTYWKDMWYSTNELVREIALGHLEGVRADSALLEQRKMENKVAAILSQGSMTRGQAEMAGGAQPPAPLEIVYAKIARQKEEERLAAEQEAERKRKAAEEEQKALEEAKRKAEAEEQQKAEADKRYEQTAPAGFMGTPFDASTIFIALVSIIIVAAGVVIWVKRSKKADNELDVSKFFEGKGQLQKEFWAAAEADPKNFRYVSYLFDTMSAAKAALQKLSFIIMSPNGKLQCRRKDLLFGVYEHQGRAVAFIGGATLNYARWREASMRWPELPGANYFKVSVEPSVAVDMSKMEELAKDSTLQITSLGQEDRQLPSGEIKRMFLYSTPSAELARAFLEKFTISDDGVVVQVTCEDGAILSKDSDHVFDGKIEDVAEAEATAEATADESAAAKA